MSLRRRFAASETAGTDNGIRRESLFAVAGEGSGGEAFQTPVVRLETGASAAHRTAGSRRNHTFRSREPGRALPRPLAPLLPLPPSESGS